MNTSDSSVSAYAAMEEGIAAADSDDAPEKQKEASDVGRWMRRINSTLGFDADAHRNYVRCRRYARGDSGFMVDANIVGTNLDISEAFLYAKNPDVDVLPAKAVEIPGGEALVDAAMYVAEQSEEVEKAQQLATSSLVLMAQQALATGQPFDAAAAQKMTQETVKAITEIVAAAALAKLKAEYSRRQRENKAYAETGELVISRFWHDGRLKDRGRPWVRSMLTIGPGIFKGAYQQRTAPSPDTVSAIADLQQQLQRVAELRKRMADESGDELEASEADLQRQLRALQDKEEPVISKGFVVDNVAGENFVVAPGFRIVDHMDAPWNAERIPMELDEACALYKLTRTQKAMVTKYMARRPVIERPISAGSEGMGEVDPREAQQFLQGNAMVGPDTLDRDGADGLTGAGHFVMVWEIWDKTSNSVLTTIEGLTCWVRPSWTPPPTLNFYPYFVVGASEVDGSRHPQGPVERSRKLVDEYNRIGSAEAKHRARTIPKTAFNAGAFEKGEAEKLERAGVQEMVALKLTNPNADIRTIILPITYAAIDPTLYDRTRIIQEIERIWGIQEALGGAINVEKTATEADIQQQGTQARFGSKRDSIEGVLSRFAVYTFQLARRYLTYDEVRAIAGPNAYWPPYKDGEDVRLLLNIDIKAGTTGKPNSRLEREAWGVLLPTLKTLIAEYCLLKRVGPGEQADSIKELARITIERAGDRIDVDSLFPPAPPAMPVDPATGAPMPGAPGSAPGDAGPQPAPIPGEGGGAGEPATPTPSPAAGIPQPAAATV